MFLFVIVIVSKLKEEWPKTRYKVSFTIPHNVNTLETVISCNPLATGPRAPTAQKQRCSSRKKFCFSAANRLGFSKFSGFSEKEHEHPSKQNKTKQNTLDKTKPPSAFSIISFGVILFRLGGHVIPLASNSDSAWSDRRWCLVCLLGSLGRFICWVSSTVCPQFQRCVC